MAQKNTNHHLNKIDNIKMMKDVTVPTKCHRLVGLLLLWNVGLHRNPKLFHTSDIHDINSIKYQILKEPRTLFL
ncbi:hypothetical protein AQUCO_00600377v1 [Aquilegia coerulea]|uniref:Uncharacterized protein n=1 Tax=Aquilegia coerulea TaxID=218851 RepID=A0A2G5EPC9_AQUCA|nr:hypothetical protein AQUCO_00600377v1 [Aquilegia coerulea]